MFRNRRRKAASNPPLNGSNANPSAATAAAQAFLKNQASNATLSSAAAAAALRSLPTPPTSVADVQTKRTLRRTGSNSSMGSSVAASSTSGHPGSTVQRRGSFGSMSERTFREPSPSQPVPSAIDAPPVPAIPNHIPSSNSNSHRRAGSLETPPMRIASPRPAKANSRGPSLEPTTTARPQKRAGQRITSLSSTQELTGIERVESRGSVNFSHPTGLRPTSPIPQRQLTSPSSQRINSPTITAPHNQNLVYDPNTRSFLPAAEIYTIEQSIRDVANKPVKKKKRVAPKEYTGTHLADGTVGGRPRGTAVDAMEAQASKPIESSAPAPVPTLVPTSIAPIEPLITTPTKKKRKKVVAREASDSEIDQVSHGQNPSDNESDIQSTTLNSRAGVRLAKKPSIVREDPEREEQEDDTPEKIIQEPLLSKLDPGAHTVSPSTQTRSSAGRGHGRGQALASAAYAEGQQHARSASQPAPSALYSIHGIPTEPGPTAEEGVRGSRVQSVSPVRTTHFATTPDNLIVKHQPPPRSISPRKSALKHSNSPRGPSPVDGIPETFGLRRGQSSSNRSSSSTVAGDELPVPRKKAVRVSFDETNVLVGEAAAPVTTDSPIAQSPQVKRGWLGISIGKKNDASAMEDSDDVVMKPRPALPSFGSVRDKKYIREQVEERPLVKPSAPVESTAAKPPPILATSSGEVMEFPVGQSNDHKVGAILAQDALSKNEANISKSREPLPPQVLSVEGSGYHSETDSTVSDVVEKQSGVETVGKVQHDHKDQQVDTDNEQVTVGDHESEIHPQAPISESNGEVPEIAILRATPTLEDARKRSEWLHMPGGFPGESQSHDESSHQQVPPVLDETPRDNLHTVPAIQYESEDSDASIYSDAAEDLPDVDEDGFMSLDAIVETPLRNIQVVGITRTTPPESPAATSEKIQLLNKPIEPDLDDGWGKAQEYWKGLSAEKKRQMEQDAREDAEASDSTVEVKPAPKPKNKKKVPVQPAPVTVPEIYQATKNDRIYMIQPGSKAGANVNTLVMRSSMRTEPPNLAQDAHMRKSMRGLDSMRGSLRGPSETVESRGSLQKKHRKISLPTQDIKADPTTVQTHVRQLSAASAAAASGAAQRDMARPAPVLRRKSSADSDSSFKRARRPNEGSVFRRSMRGSADQNLSERPLSPMHSSRFSLRSVSPSGSAFRRPVNSGGAPSVSPSQTHMRSSLRSSYESSPSLRASRNEKPGMRIPGFGRSSSSKQAQRPVRQQRSSRFADSSDEDDTRPSFRSRFIDSSGDEGDTPVPGSGGMRGSMRANVPVQGIPKRAGAENSDSSDLPDSDDERSPGLPSSPRVKLSKNRQNGVAALTSNQGVTIASGSLRRSGSGRGTLASPTTTTIIEGPPTRPIQSRRSSFMSILRRKKPDPSAKVRKSEAESPARRDTPLERSRSEIQAVKRQESYNSISGRSVTPKLQKKSPSWPLPLDEGDKDGRPLTADAEDTVVDGHSRLTNGNGATNGGGRPDLGTGRFTATSLREVDLNGVTAQVKKKKKFGSLRRMFGLHD